jgi:hypothetical protein
MHPCGHINEIGILPADAQAFLEAIGVYSGNHHGLYGFPGTLDHSVEVMIELVRVEMAMSVNHRQSGVKFQVSGSKCDILFSDS